MRNRIEDGMGCAGLVPTAEERNSKKAEKATAAALAAKWRDSEILFRGRNDLSDTRADQLSKCRRELMAAFGIEEA